MPPKSRDQLPAAEGAFVEVADSSITDGEDCSVSCADEATLASTSGVVIATAATEGETLVFDPLPIKTLDDDSK